MAILERAQLVPEHSEPEAYALMLFALFPDLWLCL